MTQMTQTTFSQQRGGTLIGLILGVLIGLAAALAVAVYVTKVPVPFVDRALTRKPAEDAAEAERNKNWNPNASLGSGGAIKAITPPPPAEKPAAEKAPAPEPAPAQPVREAQSEPVAKPAAPVAEAKPVVPPAKAKTESADPLGDLAQSKMATKTAAASGAAKPEAESSVGTFVYFVQAGAYRTPEDAQAQRAKLLLMGLDASTTEREQSGRTVYRVRMGPYERQADAEKMKDNLASNGVEAALVRVQR
jgi:cell division protein FtsN